jgi:uncharacterized damage-inducible protein DinB
MRGRYSLKTIHKMYEHLHWANLRILEDLKTREETNHQAKQLFSHILLAEEVWFMRIKGLDSIPQALWTELSSEECLKFLEKNNQNFTELLAGLSDTNVDQPIVYKNSTGKEFTTSIRDIVTHVALHGQYHRGQINRVLRGEGFEPVNVDFITFVR